MIVASCVAAALVLEPATALAQAATRADASMAGVDLYAHGYGAPVSLLKPKKKPKKKKAAAAGPAKVGPELSLESADSKRQAIRDAVKSDIESGNLEDAASTLERNGTQLGDPIVMLEAADLRLQVADKERDIEQAELAIESSRIAADIAGYYEDVESGSVESAWLVIDPSTAGEVGARAEGTIERAEELIAAIEEERRGDEAATGSSKPSDKPKKKREKKPGTGMMIAGGAFTAVGVAGLSMALAGLVISSQKQNDVEKVDLDPDTDTPEVHAMKQAEIDRLDKEGNRANVIAFAGMGVAVAGFAVGIPLLVIGAKKRKQAKSPPASAALRLTPRVSRGSFGLALSGKF